MAKITEIYLDTEECLAMLYVFSILVQVLSQEYLIFQVVLEFWPEGVVVSEEDSI